MVVEGVEDAATLQVLRELRCDVVQGFHLSRPLPLAALLPVMTASAAVPLSA